MEFLYSEDVKNILGEILSTLDERDRMIIMLRYGFVDGECWTLQKIGDEFGITREGVRKIEKKLIEYIKSLFLDEKLNTYLK